MSYLGHILLKTKKIIYYYFMSYLRTFKDIGYYFNKDYFKFLVLFRDIFYDNGEWINKSFMSYFGTFNYIYIIFLIYHHI